MSTGLNDFTLIKNNPTPINDINFYVATCKTLFKQKKYKECLEVIKNAINYYPSNPLLYSLGASAYISLKAYNEAEEMCRNGMERAPSPLHDLNIAHIEILRKNFSTAIENLENIKESFKRSSQFYNLYALAYLGSNQYDKAVQISKEGIKNAKSYHHLLNLSKVYLSQNSFEEAIQVLNIFKNEYPIYYHSYYHLIEIYLAKGEIKIAEKIAEEGLINAPCLKLYNLWASIPLVYDNISDSKPILNAITRYFIVYKKFLHIDTLKTISNLSRLLIKENFFYYNLCLESLFNSLRYSKNVLTLNTSKKICFYYRDLMHLKYYENLFQYIYTNNIVFDSQSELPNDISKKFKIDYGYHNLKNYDIIITDISCFSNNIYSSQKNISNFFKKIIETKIVIGLCHFIDTPMKENVLKIFDCIILGNQKQLHFCTNIQFSNASNKNIGNLKNIPLKNKTEVGISGPFHMEAYLSMNNRTKNELRKELEEFLSFKVPDDKPVIACLEDEITLMSHLLVGLNKLSEFATIIFKPHFMRSSHLLKNLNSNVIIYPDSTFAPNLLRFSSDFVMAGVRSSTFLSSIMCGVPVIPYYSRYIKGKKASLKKSKPFKWINSFPKYKTILTLSSSTILIDEFKNKNYLFDILDTNAIKNAILDKSYINWFNKNLSSLQNKAFGNYTLNKPAELTATHIKNFIENLTLGRSCDSFCIK